MELVEQGNQVRFIEFYRFYVTDRILPLAELKYIEKALSTLDEKYDQLNIISQLLEIEFKQIVELNNVDYLNIVTRVKGRDSLKEKILRQGYYKKYNDPKRLIYELSDLIGIRIECRFEENERTIYKMLKKHFNVRTEDGHYYNELNPNIRLCLDGRQPQKQKNGFKIFRLDGYVTDTKYNIPFELQIKSLVNVFWGEIEHKIIYKNYNFLLADTLLIEMLHSIKNNLALLDKQLLSIYRNVELRTSDEEFQRKGLENMLAKMCNDIFAKQIKNSIGMNVNIKKACQTIMNYTFNGATDKDQGEMLISAMQRLNEISSRTVQFNTPILFERDPVYATPFSILMGPYFIDVMNKEFHWNLFFKILFEIDYQDNVGDFEKFLGYLEHIYFHAPLLNKTRQSLYAQFEEGTDVIINDLTKTIAYALIEIDDIEVVYDYNMDKISIILNELYRYLITNLTSLGGYEDRKVEILSEFKLKIIESLS